MATSLQHFLNAHRCPKGANTHCGAGLWLIPPDDEPTLHALLAAAAHVPYIVEDTLPSGCAPLVLDLDFSAAAAPPEGRRLWEVSGLKEGWASELALACVRTYEALTEGVSRYITFYVLERPTGYMSAKKGKYVDDIHIHAPQLFCDLAIHRHARQLVLAELPAPMRTVLEQVWDLEFNKATAPGRGKLAMFGTGKMGEPECRPYQLSQQLSVSVVSVKEESIQLSREDLVSITSIRNEMPELHLREGTVLPEERATLRALPPAQLASANGGGAAGLAAAEAPAAVAAEASPVPEPVSEEQWLDVEALVGMLSVERAAISGLKAEHKAADTKGCAQVINVVYHLSGGSKAGEALALRFAQSATTWWDTPPKATRSLAWVTKMWTGSAKYERNAKERNMCNLDWWAKKDSPERHKEYVFKVPLFKPRQLTFTPPTAEEVVKLVGEVVPDLLEREPAGWQLVPDKLGVLPFNHRYLFESSPGDKLAGLNNYDLLVPPPLKGEVTCGGEVLVGEPTAEQRAQGLVQHMDPPAPKATVAICSHLGTGKTSLFKHIALKRISPSEFTFPKVCYISARRTFTQSQMWDMTELVTTKKLIKGKGVVEVTKAKGVGFVSYLDLKGQLSAEAQQGRRLFCQTESLHRFLEGGELPPKDNLHYNVVILDELESIVASLKPSTTMRNKLLDNLNVFQELVRSADVVVAGDAFITQRSLDVLADLRHDLAPLRLIINHANPYGADFQARTMKRCYVMAEAPKGKMSKAKLDKWVPHERIEDSIRLFQSRLTADLKAGLKVVVVWGSRRAGLAYEAYLKKEFYEPSERSQLATVIQRWVRWLKAHPRNSQLPPRIFQFSVKPSVRAFGDAREPPTVGKKRPVSSHVPRLFASDVPPSTMSALLQQRFRYKYFHSGNKATARQLSNLDAKWAKLNYLAYSPTITVGVNYNPTPFTPPQLPNMFNRLYIYACRFGATPRDLFQASLRVRVIQPPPGEPHLIYVIDQRGGAPAYSGLESCEVRLKELKSATLSAAQQLKRLTKREQEQGLTFLPSGAQLRTAPPWFDKLLARNLNEANVSSSFPEEVYAHYLALCGYVQPDDVPEFLGDVVLIDKLAKSTPYATIPLISKCTAELLKVINAGTKLSLTLGQQLALNKFYFHQRMGLPSYDWGGVGVDGQLCGDCAMLKQAELEKHDYRDRKQLPPCNHLPEWQPETIGVPLVLPANATAFPEWATPELLDLLWRGQVSCPKPCPLSPAEAAGEPAAGGGGGEPQHACVEHDSEDGFFFSGVPSKFKQIALAKLEPAAALEQALKMDFYDSGGSLDYSERNTAARLQVMSLLTAELGLEHAGKAHTWSQEEVRDLVPKLTEERQWPDLEVTSSLQGTSLLQRAMYVFGLRDRSGRGEGGEDKRQLSPPEQVGAHLNMLFGAWCLSSVRVLKEHRIVQSGEAAGSKRTPTKVRPPNAPTWNQVQTTPEYKELAKLKGKSPEKLVEDKAAMLAMKAKWEADYPLETPILGVELVPWQGLADAGTGRLWSLVPALQASTAAQVVPMFRDDVE